MMGVAEKLFLGVLNMSVTGSIVILSVLLVRIFLRKVPRIFSYLLWMVVLFRLLCPISFEASFSLFGGMPVAVQEQGNLTYVSIQGDVFEDIDEITNMNEMTAENIVTPAEDRIPTPLEGSISWKDKIVSIGSVIWLVGMGVLLMYSVVSLLKLNKKLKEAQHVQDNVYLTKVVDTPFVIGLFRPRIYLPAMLMETEKSYILLHEQIHIRRGDHIVKIVSFLALCLHWFNPLVWLAFFLSGKDMEMSCDEAVIRKIGNDMKKEYSASLLSLATGRKIVSGVPLAFGEGDTGSRIKNVLQYRKPATVVVVIVLVVCVAVSVILMANPNKKPSDSTDITTQTSVSEQPKEVLYGIVKDVEWEGNVNRLLMIPGMGEIEIPKAEEVYVYFERESQELLPGDLVEITFGAGEEVSVLETWPGRFTQDAESMVVMWQGCDLEYEGEDIYQFIFPAGIVQGNENMAVDDILSIYWNEEGKETEVLAKTPILKLEESEAGIRLATVRLATDVVKRLFEGQGFHITYSVEKAQPVVFGHNAVGPYPINVRSLNRAERSIDSYVSDYQSTYEDGGPLYFADECIFKVNVSMQDVVYKEISFDEFVEIIGEEDSFLNQPCLCTFKDNEIVEICLFSAWNKNGITVSTTPPTSTFYDYVVDEDEYYSLVRTETMDVAYVFGEEMIEIYTGNLGDGDSGFVLFKDAEGNLIYTQEAHSTRAGWNNIYVGQVDERTYITNFIMNVYIEDRGDYGTYGYWVYKLEEDGEVRMIAGSEFNFDLSEESKYQYNDELFREWIEPMEYYLEKSHLLLSTQDGEVRTEKVSEADKYNYETLSLKNR